MNHSVSGRMNSETMVHDNQTKAGCCTVGAHNARGQRRGSVIEYPRLNGYKKRHNLNVATSLTFRFNRHFFRRETVFCGFLLVFLHFSPLLKMDLLLFDKTKYLSEVPPLKLYVYSLILIFSVRLYINRRP